MPRAIAMFLIFLSSSSRAGEKEITRWIDSFLTANQNAPAPKDPLWKNLPGEITRDYPQKEGFVQFHHMDGDVPPVGGRIRFSDPNLKLTDVFGDESFARLPEGSSIGRSTKNGREYWDYPVGTRVMHRITLKSDPPTLFELRLVQKMPNGQWSFGIYTAEAGSDVLQLHRAGMPQLSFDATISGKPVHVDMYKLSPTSCRACHFGIGHGGYQYPDADHVGPCGFSPPNPHLATEWARDYEARYGYRPFVP